MKNYDVIVIGSGIGGLVSAGILASGGMKPLVIEKHTSPGGYVSSFRRSGFLFDSVLDCISGAGPGGLINRVLRLLNIDNEVRFHKVDPVRVSRFPDLNVVVDADLRAYKERLVELFPCEASAIEEFVKTISSAYSQMESALQVIISGTSRLDILTPDFLQLMDTSYSDMLSAYFHDHRLRAALSDRCPFMGLPPDGVSSAAMINLMMSYFKLGAYRPEGGFQQLSDLIVQGIQKMGGDIVLADGVDQILFNEKNDCRGVRCDSGKEYTSRYVVSNADFIETFSNLIGGKYAELASDMKVRPGISTSFFILYAGVRGELDAHSSTGFYPSYEMNMSFEPGMEFSPDSTIGVTIATKEDKCRAPAGFETVVFHEMTAGQDLHREECTEKVLDKAESIFPGLRDSIVLIETAMPSTLQRYTGNHHGAAFGWKQAPGFRGPKRHGITNLHIAGHWGDFGGGVLAAAYSGAKAACEILAKEGIRNVL
ncbi:MAG TPA: NAD(P)/FAD-dependent oxidoreductase [Dissulfurispiraceae bacterium]|nr:NAD(P)/FAD-dependent oxidoreductase [Dissulfurispiraceae bacterium]